MTTRPTPEAEALRRHAEWVSENYLAMSRIVAAAEDLKAHAKILKDSAHDPNGRRVAQLRRFHRRLLDVFADLDDLPEAKIRRVEDV